MSETGSRASLVILTYNGRSFLEELFGGINMQTIKPEIIVIDSESSDGTREYLANQSINYRVIPKAEFNHGGTRNLGLSLASNDIVIFLTQDVILQDEQALERLIEPLINKKNVAMSFGRQLPKHDATVLSEFARINNYPDQSILKSERDIKKLGIKTCFISNSFAAYKKSILFEIGKFPSHLIMCKDVFAGAKAILKGYEIAYVAEARAYHSHNYSVSEEFKRYFDIGYFYNSESWILTNFSKAEAEGLSYLKKEFLYIFKRKRPHLLPEFFVRSVAKYLGYKLGRYPSLIPDKFKKYVSMHSYYWNQNRSTPQTQTN